MRVQLKDILTELNEDLDLFGTKYKNDRAIFNLLKYSMNENFKFILPEGEINYNKFPFTPGFAPISLYVELLDNKLDIFTRKEVKKEKLEFIFTDLLKNLDANDAEILQHIKDQTLFKLYPNLTKKSILPYFTNE